MDFFETRFFELVRSFVLGLAIAVLFPLTIYYAIQLFYPMPKHPPYIERPKEISEMYKKLTKLERTKKTLLAYPERQKELQVERIQEIDKEVNVLEDQIEQLEKSFKEERDEKMKAYNVQMKPYEQVFFAVTTVAGLFAILIGALLHIPSLGFGFILGGVSSLTMGYMRFWGRMHDMFKFVSLLAAIVLIVLLGFYLIRRRRD